MLMRIVWHCTTTGFDATVQPMSRHADVVSLALQCLLKAECPTFMKFCFGGHTRTYEDPADLAQMHCLGPVMVH